MISRFSPTCRRNGCISGVDCNVTSHMCLPISTGHRPLLTSAAIRLLTFVLRGECEKADNCEQSPLKRAFTPLLKNEGHHFVATVTALLLAILESKTDFRLSGVFWAGKTIAAAATLAGLLVMEHPLTIMVVTKENAAAQALAEHLLSLALPGSIIPGWSVRSWDSWNSLDHHFHYKRLRFVDFNSKRGKPL